MKCQVGHLLSCNRVTSDPTNSEYSLFFLFRFITKFSVVIDLNLGSHLTFPVRDISRLMLSPIPCLRSGDFVFQIACILFIYLFLR